MAVGLGLLAFSLQNYFWGGSHELNDRTKKASSGKEMQHLHSKEFDVPKIIKVSKSALRSQHGGTVCAR